MKWPWTSIARLDDAMQQVAFLREANTKLTESLTRISRREVGLPEVPREARPPLEPMPPELAGYISEFANASVRKTMRDTALRQHAAGKSWAAIVADTMAEEEVQ